METSHRVRIGDSRDMAQLEDDSVELVVTSPPYPMIEMWDGLFSELAPGIERELATGNGQAACESMHEELGAVWDEVSRVLVDGGIACVNIGDATRKVDGSFRVYQNHARIITAFEERGFEPLPDVLWRKPTNSAAKFMGSGMIPTNAYVTLEHEYILVFRNGKDQRRFEPGSERRYEAAYFWEERNQWFTDVWEDVNGTFQSLDHTALRDRSGAFPCEIPYRLINMYTVYGDTVLDPFWGTGTTTIAAMIAGRNSVGYEIEDEFTQIFDERTNDISDISRKVVHERLDDHRAFVEQRRTEGNEFKYEAENYDFPVTTKQETSLQLYTVASVESRENGYVTSHETVDSSDIA
jgi:DNA modification methylase